MAAPWEMYQQQKAPESVMPEVLPEPTPSPSPQRGLNKLDIVDRVSKMSPQEFEKLPEDMKKLIINPRNTPVDAFVDRMATTSTFGQAPKIKAAIETSPIGTQQDKSYQQALGANKELLQAQQQNFPAASLGGNVAGTFVGPAGMLSSVFKASTKAPFAYKLAAGMGQGASSGLAATMGANPDAKLEDLPLPVVLGTMIGGAFPAIGKIYNTALSSKMGQKAANFIQQEVSPALTKAGLKSKTLVQLNQASDDLNQLLAKQQPGKMVALPEGLSNKDLIHYAAKAEANKLIPESKKLLQIAQEAGQNGDNVSLQSAQYLKQQFGGSGFLPTSAARAGDSAEGFRRMSKYFRDKIVENLDSKEARMVYNNANLRLEGGIRAKQALTKAINKPNSPFSTIKILGVGAGLSGLEAKRRGHDTLGNSILLATLGLLGGNGTVIPALLSKSASVGPGLTNIAVGAASPLLVDETKKELKKVAE